MRAADRDGNPVLLVGRGQAVRHETLDLASGGSNPPAPAMLGPGGRSPGLESARPAPQGPAGTRARPTEAGRRIGGVRAWIRAGSSVATPAARWRERSAST